MNRIFVLNTRRLLCVLLFAVSAVSCKKDPVKTEPKITNLSETTITFVVDDTEMEKTLSFNSTKDWQLDEFDADWLEINPQKGEAGDAELTIKLLEPSIDEERSVDVHIVSETAKATFKVVQKAPVVIDVENVEIINAPASLYAGDEAVLTAVVTPENATYDGVKWSSSSNCVEVDGEGNIIAKSAGKATITAVAGGVGGTCEIEVIAFNGTVYTFKKLSEEPDSGVTVENDVYVVSSNFEIAETDMLRLEDNITVKIKHKIEITVKGILDFTPATGSTITRYDDDSHPASIYLTGESSGGNAKNVMFIDVPIRVFVQNPFTVDNCEFKYIHGDTKKAALDMGTTAQVTVTNCRFIENGYPAISGGANYASPLVFKNNYLYKNSASASNRPQINVVVGGDGLVDISDNEIIGPAEITKNGGIAVANLLGLSGTNKVLIKNNKVRDCRYGITTNGVMDVQIVGNELKDNKYESNPMNGGSGISIYNSKGGQKVFISENTITGHLWGIAVIGSVSDGKGPTVNLGNQTEGDDYNVGKNIFSDNGNNGTPYDLYNNTPFDISAVNNNWGSTNQTEEEIEKVIYHKVDDETLGTVAFMPPYIP